MLLTKPNPLQSRVAPTPVAPAKTATGWSRTAAFEATFYASNALVHATFVITTPLVLVRL